MNVVTGFIRSDEGHAALEYGVKEVKERGGRLYIVHSSEGGRHENSDEVIADNQELERIGEELKTSGVEFDIRRYARGFTPAEDVVDVANEIGADLIVIGLRRRSLVGKILLGSNAQDILTQANCPVLAVKPTNKP